MEVSLVTGMSSSLWANWIQVNAHYLMDMKQSDIFRENAENCMKLAEIAPDQPAFMRFTRMARGWRALANEQDWLDGERITYAA
jgi:hypothetical protein